MTTIAGQVAAMLAITLLLSACLDSRPPTVEQRRAQQLAADQEAENTADRKRALARCRTEAVVEFTTHMSARRHHDAANVMRLCAAALPDQDFKQMFADAESKAYIDDIEDPKASTFEKVRVLEMLARDYPAVAERYASRGVDLRMRLQEEQRVSAEAIQRATVPKVGMSADGVRSSAWGPPDRVNRTTTASGSREQWVYGGGRYVYLENGLVVAVQD